MQPANTIQELRQRFKRIKSGVADDTIFGARALMFMCERLAVATNGKKRHPASPWQRFFGNGIRAGKTAKQIAREWKAERGEG